MQDFGKQMRARLDADNQSRLLVALEGVSTWLAGEVTPILAHRLEEAVRSGLDRVSFVHSFVNGYRLEIDDLEDSVAYQHFKDACANLGLDQLPLSHKLLKNRDSQVYPCLEIIVRLP